MKDHTEDTRNESEWRPQQVNIHIKRWGVDCNKNQLRLTKFPSAPLSVMLAAVQQNLHCRNGEILPKLSGIWLKQSTGWSQGMWRWGRLWRNRCCDEICHDWGDAVAAEIVMVRKSSVAILFFCVTQNLVCFSRWTDVMRQYGTTIKLVRV